VALKELEREIADVGRTVSYRTFSFQVAMPPSNAAAFEENRSARIRPATFPG
jgi:hypothetical protein